MQGMPRAQAWLWLASIDADQDPFPTMDDRKPILLGNTTGAAMFDYPADEISGIIAETLFDFSPPTTRPSSRSRRIQKRRLFVAIVKD